MYAYALTKCQVNRKFPLSYCQREVICLPETPLQIHSKYFCNDFVVQLIEFCRGIILHHYFSDLTVWRALPWPLHKVYYKLCANLIESHASPQSSHSWKLNTISWVIKLTYLHEAVKCESLLCGHTKARCTVSIPNWIITLLWNFSTDNGHGGDARSRRELRMWLAEWGKVEVLISWLFHVVWLSKWALTVLEFNCNERVRYKEKRKQNIVFVTWSANIVHTYAKHVNSRRAQKRKRTAVPCTKRKNTCSKRCITERMQFCDVRVVVAAVVVEELKQTTTTTASQICIFNSEKQ